MPTPGLDLRAILRAHATQHKLSPSQQFNLVLFYIVLLQMFPELSFTVYLERAARLYGATDANLQFAKDALDHHCPTKGSQWPPAARIELLLRYAEVSSILFAEGGTIGLNDFLAGEVPNFQSSPQGAALTPEPTANPAPAPTPVPSVTPPQPQPVATAPVTPPVAAPVQAPACDPPTQLLPGYGEYRDINDKPIQGFIYDVYAIGDRQLVGFLSTEGKYYEDAEAARCRTTSLPERADVTVEIEPKAYARMMEFLTAAAPISGTELGSPLMTVPFKVGDNTGMVNVYNAQPSPLVDVSLVDPDHALVFAFRPTKRLLGFFPFMDQGRLVLVYVQPQPQ